MFRSNAFKIFSSLFLLVSLAIGVYLVGVKTGFIKIASGTPANLVVDLGTNFENPADCWKNLSQGGESRDRMLAPVIGEVKNLNPRYIRIDHIYDNYDVVSKDSSGNLNFNWQNLDQTINDIRSTGATPFFSLSYMSPTVSKSGQVDDMPANLTDWQTIIQRTIEHYSGKNGLNIQNVYYEVWNEPDNFGKFTLGGSKNYLDLYYYAQLGAVNAQNVNNFKIGGPATSGLYKSWFDPILQMASSHSIRLDFYSWHNYYVDVNNYDRDVQYAYEWLAGYPGFRDLELVISEMGIDPSNNKAYDNNFGAINTLATVSVIQGNINKCFSFEIIDGTGSSQYWGRWGLLTNPKFGTPIKKPRYYALQFLNNMTGNRVAVNGVGTWVKAFARRDTTGKVKVLVVNYDPSGSNSEAVPIKLVNLPAKKFLYRKIIFLGGSLDREVIIDPNVTEWSTVEYMDPNTATIFEIIPE